jgi:hypothetical protein
MAEKTGSDIVRERFSPIGAASRLYEPPWLRRSPASRSAEDAGSPCTVTAIQKPRDPVETLGSRGFVLVGSRPVPHFASPRWVVLAPDEADGRQQLVASRDGSVAGGNGVAPEEVDDDLGCGRGVDVKTVASVR